MRLAPGMRLRSAVCSTEVVVVVAREPDVELCCGGHPMVAMSDEVAPAGLVLADTTGTLLGKRYAVADAGLEVLCTKAGEGGLTVGGEPVPLKDAKPLPSSD